MRATRLHRDTLERMVVKATMAGRCVRESQTRWSIDYAGACQHPVHRELFSSYDVERQARVALGNRGPMTVTITCRCRKCDWCLGTRRAMWRHRATVETHNAVRTWFGTLTLSPTEHTRALAQCRVQLGKQGIDFDALPYAEQFALRHRVHSKQLTDYLKRVREDTKAPMRFLLVCEAHKTGLPHYHMLIHEQDELQPIRKRVLQAQWDKGFSSFKLVREMQQATYLCKYLAKTTAARVRSSVRYGALEDALKA